MEIERKFLVKRDDSFRKMVASSSMIAQGYMDVKGATVRIRLRSPLPDTDGNGGKAYLTIKGPSANGILVPVGKHTFEVDEFHGANDGLLFCEVELQSEDEAFEHPAWLGPEVTGNRHFYNKGLLSNPYPNWRDELPEEFR